MAASLTMVWLFQMDERRTDPIEAQRAMQIGTMLPIVLSPMVDRAARPGEASKKKQESSRPVARFSLNHECRDF
jgi:hypothetical protein